MTITVTILTRAAMTKTHLMYLKLVKTQLAFLLYSAFAHIYFKKCEIIDSSFCHFTGKKKRKKFLQLGEFSSALTYPNECFYHHLNFLSKTFF